MYRIGQEEIDAVAKVINGKKLFRITDPDAPIHEVMDFEREMKEYLNAEHFFALTSGTAALISALVGLGIGPGDEVLVPAYTYIGTPLSALAVGAIPVVVDVDDTLSMSPAAVEAAITPNTKAIIPVHMKGSPADMASLCAIAKKHGIFVIEDACLAVGGSFQGKKLGTWGDAGAYSYNYYKNIGAGDGGGLAIKDHHVYERAYIFHDSSGVPYFGKNLDNMDEYLYAGSEFRTNEINAAILRVQLSRLDGILADLRGNRSYILKQIKDTGLKKARSNDFEGDCGNIIRFAFDDAATSEKFQALLKAEDIYCERPIKSGRFLCWNWEILFRHKGALNDKMNPYLMEANQGLRMDYDRDMCPQSREYLSRQCYFSVKPDWNKQEMDAIIAKLQNIAKQL